MLHSFHVFVHSINETMNQLIGNLIIADQIVLKYTIQCMEIMEELHKRSNKPQTLEVSHLEQLGSETVENVTLFGDDLCVICQDTFEEGQVIRRLDCGHTFHKDCIDPYLTNYKMECPTDRKKVMVPEVEKITVEKKKNTVATGRRTCTINSRGCKSCRGYYRITKHGDSGTKSSNDSIGTCYDGRKCNNDYSIFCKSSAWWWTRLLKINEILY